MKLSRLIILILAIGLLSIILLGYFYAVQRDFTTNHREFLISINNLDHSQGELNNLILQSSIYVYSNQDRISNMKKRIRNEYESLKNSAILKQDNYKSINKEMVFLKNRIDSNIDGIEEYLMLNASIKNSLIFLTRHVDNATDLQKKDKDLFINAYKISKNFHNAKGMQDLDYLSKNPYLLKSNSKSKETKVFVNNFNNHTKYMAENYPKYIAMTKQVVENDINDYIDKIRKDFSKLALTDFYALDMFASVLFTIFVVALSIIVILFIKYLQENKKLLSIKESLEHSLRYDQLTNLYNRKAFEKDVSTLDLPHLLILNIDNFKHINDVYGNTIGNAVLKDLAELLQLKLTNVEAKIYRLGGDEFGVLFSNIDEKKALKIANLLEEEISYHSFIVNELDLNIFVSVASNNIHPILENADLALKLLKQDHSKRVIAYNDSLNLTQDIKHNMKILKILKNAIIEDRVIPYFQPIIDLKISKIVKYEALVRIKQDDGTILSPYEFLDIAKKTPYYYDITRIMIEKTLKVAKEFPKQRFSINISMIDILNEKLVEILLTKLQENIIMASRLDIELLESENMHDITKVQNFITEVKKYGSKILIDDFGSGYANFSHFSRLDIDIVKIDGSIVNGINIDDRKLHMLKSIHKFTQGMGLENIAEFVETKQLADLLKDIGIRYAQGYYFSKPLEYPLKSNEVDF